MATHASAPDARGGAPRGYRLTKSGELAHHIGISSERAALGFAIGGVLGLLLGILTGSSRIAERLIDSTVQMLRTVPHLALIPLVILWLGVGESAKVFLVALGVLFPVYLNTHHGVRRVDPGLNEMGQVYGLGRGDPFRKVLLPGALPSILVGVRYALGVMWLTLIVSETIAATSGIGYLAMNAREFMRTDVVVLSILLYALLGTLADTIARGLERLLLPWHPAHAAAVTVESK
jgi:sulfonate transport system permease protein